MNKTFRSIVAAGSLCLATSAAAQEAPPDVELRVLAEGVWVHTSHRALEDGQRFPSHGLVVREGDTLTLIDTAWGETETGLLLDAIAVQIGLPVTRAVVTHFHGDRASGTGLLQTEGVEVWAHPMTREFLTERNYAVPSHALEGIETPGEAVDFGTLEVFYPGGAHTHDNIMVFLPDQNILFGGCAIRGANDRELGNVRDADVGHWATAMKLTEERYGAVGMVVSSHAEPAGPELFGHTAYLARLAD